MTPIIFDTICNSYEKQIDQLEITIATLRDELAESRELLAKADAKIDELRELVRQQNERIEAGQASSARMIAACDEVLDGDGDRPWEKQLAFTD